jgi:hypothetical protein
MLNPFSCPSSSIAIFPLATSDCAVYNGNDDFQWTGPAAVHHVDRCVFRRRSLNDDTRLYYFLLQLLIRNEVRRANNL